MKILITGAFGFVGSNLSAHLAAKGCELWALDVERALAEARSAQSVYTRLFSWKELPSVPWREVDAVVHLAGKAHDTRNTSDPQSYFDVNVGLTKRVLEAAAGNGLLAVGNGQSAISKGSDGHVGAKAQRVFVLFSSVKAVADRVDGVLTEEVTPDPKTPYGQSKLEAEREVLKFASSKVRESGTANGANRANDDNFRTLALSNFRTYVLRPCMIHGPGNKGNLNLLYGVVRKGLPWPLGAFENSRSFASVQNVCAVVEALLEGAAEPGVYQVADDEALSTNELIRVISETSGRRAHIWKLPPALVRGAARVGDALHLPLNSERLKKLTESYVVSNAKIKAALGWERMPVDVRDGIRKTLKSLAMGSRQLAISNKQ